jgi:hypothetical protein
MQINGPSRRTPVRLVNMKTGMMDINRCFPAPKT